MFFFSFRGTHRTRRCPTSLQPTTSTGTRHRTSHNSSSSSSSSSSNSSDPTPATPAIYPSNRNNERRRNFSRSRRALTRGSRTNSHRGRTDRRGANRAGVVTRRTRATMALGPTDARLRMSPARRATVTNQRRFAAKRCLTRKRKDVIGRDEVCFFATIPHVSIVFEKSTVCQPRRERASAETPEFLAKGSRDESARKNNVSMPWMPRRDGYFRPGFFASSDHSRAFFT